MITQPFEDIGIVAPVLRASHMSIGLTDKKGNIQRQLVHDIEISIRPGEMLGLVGESGSGKSLTAAAILGLLQKPLHMLRGHIQFKDRSLSSLSEKEKRNMRGKEIAYISQDYQSSFTPFFKIGRQLVEAIRSHEDISAKKAKDIILMWLERVGLPAARVYKSYPFQLSGGQLQRVSLAAALMMKPALIIADEPTTALDVLTGEQVLRLFKELQKEEGCAVLFISHNLTQVLKYADRVAVMYGGTIVESGYTEAIRYYAKHPYTQLLLQARPRLYGKENGQLATIPGEAGAIAAHGCPFSLRCPLCSNECRIMPISRAMGGDHEVACHSIVSRGEQEYGAIVEG